MQGLSIISHCCALLMMKIMEYPWLFDIEKKNCMLSKSLLQLGLFLSFTAITCGHPGNPGNGITQGSQFNLNDIVKFACNPGYVLEGTSQTQCQANGQWNLPLPTCKSKYSV